MVSAPPPVLGSLKPSAVSMSAVESRGPREGGEGHTRLPGSERSCWKLGHLEKQVALWVGQVSDRISPVVALFFIEIYLAWTGSTLAASSPPCPTGLHHHLLSAWIVQTRFCLPFIH